MSGKKGEPLVVPASQIKKAVHILGQTREGFAEAFLDETGLHASQAEMRYGEVLNEGQPEFRIWFMPQGEANELRDLRALLDDITSSAFTPDEILQKAKQVKEDHLRVCRS